MKEKKRRETRGILFDLHHDMGLLVSIEFSIHQNGARHEAARMR